MLSGENRPFISETNVRAALNALVYTSSPEPASPLRALLMVDRFLTNPDLPASTDARAFAVNRILISQITNVLDQQRQALGFPPLEPHETLKDSLAHIAAAAQTGSAEFLGWSLLYYHFVRVDLDMTTEAFSTAAHIDERTARRYQHHAIKRLTELLILEEWKERTKQRKRRLYTELPTRNAVCPLFGRERELIQIQQIVSATGLRHIFITGASGTGKTALAQEALRRQIEADELDHIVWIDAPQSVEYVRACLAEALLPENSGINLREYLLLYRVTVVLDEIRLLLNDVEELEHLLEYLSSARVLLTSRVYHPLRSIAAHYALNELEKRDACALIGALMREGKPQYEQTGDSEIGDLIWDRAGGNPLAIALAVRNWAFFGLSGLLELRDADRLFAHISAVLDDHLTRVWLMFALMPPEAIASQTLFALWPFQVNQSDIDTLLGYHLLESSDAGGYVLAATARCYLWQQYRDRPAVRQQVDSLVATMQGDNLDISFDAIEHMLLTNWPVVKLEQRRRWISRACDEGIQRGHWARWRTILEQYREQVGELKGHQQIALGICLRHLCQWDAAERAFQYSVQRTGQQGLFVEQASALIEWSILLRYRGRYQQAFTVAQQAERLAAQYQERALHELAVLEMAQIAIDIRDVTSARSHLESLPESTVVLSLWSEIALLEQNFELSRALAWPLREQIGQNDAARARLETLIGRSYKEQGDLGHAQLHFAMALTLLEQQNDAFAVARAQLNLGAVLLHMRCYEEARLLLERAEQIQVQLGDSVALAATRHNLRLLSGRFGG